MENTEKSTNLNRRFLIEINGQFVSKMTDNEAVKTEEKQPATIGDRDDAAVFTLQNGLLQSSNGIKLLVLGRWVHESTEFEAMSMYWTEQFDRVKSVQYTGEGDGVELESFEFPLGALLDEDGKTRLYACHPSMDIGPGTKLHWLETKE